MPRAKAMRTKSADGKSKARIVSDNGLALAVYVLYLVDS